MHRFRNPNRFKTDNRDSFDNRPTCRYGATCYQKSPHHLQRFKHPDLPAPAKTTWTNKSNKRKINVDTQNSKQVAKKLNTGSGSSDKLEKKPKAESESTAAVASDSKNEEVKDNNEGLASNEASNDETVEKNGDVANESESAPEEKAPAEVEAPKEITVVDLEDENEEEIGITKTDGEDVEIMQETAGENSEVASTNETNLDEPKPEDESKEESINDKDEVKSEAKDEIESEAKDEVKSEAKDEVKNEAKDEIKSEAKDEVKSEAKDEVRSEAKDEVKSEVKDEIETEKMDSEDSVIEKQSEEVTLTKPIKTGPKDQAFYDEAQKLIVKFFLMPMPKDFFRFYDLCQELKPNDPSSAFSIVSLKLVGPYDVLNELITDETPDTKNLLTHWRYFYDPPEFQTVLKGNDREGLHFGYWRDRPSSEPSFVASNSCTVSHKIKPVAENIFGAVAGYLEERIKKANPFEKAGINNLLTKVKNFAKKHDIMLDAQTPKMKSREKNVVARTIHGAGIVCPYNKKTQLGYRELSVTDNQLLKIVKKIDDAANEEARAVPRDELAEVVRLATIAGDECDFGTCLELAHDLHSTGCTHVQNAALAMFTIAYEQLERRAFLKIAEAHLSNRKRGSNLSELTDPAPVRVGLF